MEQIVWKWNVLSDDNRQKTFTLINGDMCDLQDECDVVVCSAFKNNYVPTTRSLIGSLYRKKLINVERLSKYPELDFKNIGCWLSKETGTSFRRIACVELLDDPWSYPPEEKMDLLIKKTFSTLRYLFEQAEIIGLPIATIALPVLGTGDQGIDETYILATLISQCRTILRTNSKVDSIILYELNRERAIRTANVIDKAFGKYKESERVFLSYSTKQSELAQAVYQVLHENQISCWMAPNSIPAGSDYMEEIPIALSQVDVVILMLTPDAEKSPWVKREIGTAVGADKILVPYQTDDYTPGMKFMFLLNGAQILKDFEKGSKNGHEKLLARIQELLQK